MDLCRGTKPLDSRVDLPELGDRDIPRDAIAVHLMLAASPITALRSSASASTTS